MRKSGGFASALKSRRPASLPASGLAEGGRCKGKNRSEDRPLQKKAPERYAGVAAVAELMVAGMFTDWPS